MKSLLPKVLHRISGLTLIERVLRTAAGLQPKSVTVVVGHGADEVRASLTKRPRVQFATQEPQLGTGHALLQARTHLEGKKGTVVLLSGDAPLLTVASLRALLDTHAEAEAAATVITARLQRPFGYGRIVRTNGTPPTDDPLGLTPGLPTDVGRLVAAVTPDSFDVPGGSCDCRTMMVLFLAWWWVVMVQRSTVNRREKGQ